MIPSCTAALAFARAESIVADRRRGLGIDVGIVGQVALRVEVDREHAQIDAPEHVRWRVHGRRLARAALRRERAIVDAMAAGL